MRLLPGRRGVHPGGDRIAVEPSTERPVCPDPTRSGDKPATGAEGDTDKAEKKGEVPEAKAWVTRHQIRFGDANTRGPFQSVENQFSILDRADLAMIDPIDTGYSRAVGKCEGKDFWGVDQNIKSVSDFIVRYLDEHSRWAAPKFLLGESYGGMRSTGVAYELLTNHNVALNGIVLVSPYLDFAGGNAGLRLDEPYVNFLPTYAATAWYHNALASRPADLQPFLREVEAFAQDVYAPVLFKGARAMPEERKTVLAGLSRYTGLSEEYWNRANLRIDEGHFLQVLMRSTGVPAGRVDSRYSGGSLNGLGESMAYDPYDADVAPAIVATFNDYYRGELKVESDRPYVLSGDLWKDWDNRHQQPDFNGGGKVPWANTGVDLAHAMTMNPKMKVLVLRGTSTWPVPTGRWSTRSST